MIFSATSTHALRALAHLAADGGEQAVLGRDLAGDVGVPAHYLAKVLAVLARARVLVASRGAKGGYRLARPADEIRLIDIIEPLEGKRARPGCLLAPDMDCPVDNACSAHAAWSKAKTAFVRFLEETSLADIQGAANLRGGRGAARPLREKGRLAVKRGRRGRPRKSR